MRWGVACLWAVVVAGGDDVLAQPMIPGPDLAASETAPVVQTPGRRDVRGVIVERGSVNPVSGATVLDEIGEIAITDIDGYFTIVVGAASKELTIAAPGYATISVRIPLGAERVRIDLVKTSGAEVIEVHDTFEQTKPLSYQLTAEEIRMVPGAGNDILRAITALPGVARIPYSFGGVVLRGQSPRDSVVYLDGVEVPIAFHFGGVTSFYPGGMLKDLTVTSGGFDASYGRAQGGVVSLTTREPRTDRWRVGGSIGLLDSSVQMEGPLSHGGGIIAGVRRSYFDAIVRPFAADDVPLPSYLDVQVKTGWGDARDKGRITPMIFGSVDRVANDETSITSTFVRLAAPYHRQWGSLGLHIVPWVGINDLRFHDRDGGEASGMTTEQTFSRPTFPWGMRAELVRDYPWGHVRGGAEYSGGYLAQTSYDSGGTGNIDTEGPDRLMGDSTVAWSDIALWGEARRELLDGKLSIKSGVRVELYGLTSGRAMSVSGPLTDGGWSGESVSDGPQIVLDPRFNASYMLDATTTVRAAVGRFHQPPTPSDVESSGNPGLDSSYVDQTSLGIETTSQKTIFASATAFYHYGRDIGIVVGDPRPGASPPDSELKFGGLGPTFELLLEKQLGFAQYRESLGKARSYGLELMAKRMTSEWFTMASYTFAVSERLDIDPVGPGLLKWRPFELDQRHNLQLMVSRRWPKWRIGARFQMVSGNPYSPSRSSGDFVDSTTIPFGARLPTFYTLDMRFDRRWHRCWGDINLYFDIQNITNHYNVEGREFDNFEGHDTDVRGLPIIPFIGVELLPLI
ncbi:hypothetical protein BH11MYX2_BH11MYX2_09360 [soil metagenome]